ncbi:MAG: hypothetical protein GXO11_01250, partial [Epsilonproteobacteria bacterium]|nr:hypothetical protein [Campylobacterota bacterium]
MTSLKKIFSFNIENYLDVLSTKHKSDIKLFLILFTLLIAIFGQKLFFYSLPSDDYMRFWGDDNYKMLITNSSRWAQALLEEYIFTQKILVLPYLHGLVGIFCIALMGYLSAKFLQRKKSLEIVLTSLIISASAMFAHNLYFSSNISTWIALVIGLIGFFQLYKKSIYAKAIGFLLLLFSIGNYQSIIQVIALLGVFKALIQLIQNDEKNLLSLWKVLRTFLCIMFLTFLAYLLSFYINEIFLHYHGWHEAHRLKTAENSFQLQILLERLYSIYTVPIEFLYFKRSFYIVGLFIVLLGGIGYIFQIFTIKTTFRYKSALFVLFLITLLILPIIANLPMLLGLHIPVRAHFPSGWLIGGFFVLALVSLQGILRSINILIGIAFIIINIYYISRFFDSCARQTDADIHRANAIVERIRLHPNYTNEPMALYIIGQKKFNVLGWDMQWQQPFNSYWVRYKFLKYFTDFDFYMASPKEKSKVYNYIAQHFSHLEAYPAKSSIIVYQNIAVVILNPNKINIMLEKENLLKTFPKNKTPDIRSKFDLYLQNNILYYKKQPCSKKDTRNKFFLRIYPKNMPITYKGRYIDAFQTLDFHFYLYGKQIKDTCIAAVKLPEYKIEKIR